MRSGILYFLFFTIALVASTIGAISGIGGGVIIKPLMDAFSGLDIAVINFLSGCTVLTMSISSYIRGLKQELKINYKRTIPLALGASVGGIVGKMIFASLTTNVALIQSSMLLIINIGVFIYIIKKASIKSLHINNIILCCLIGFMLGSVSSFLGIGGGPINIAVLYYFFSMTPKLTAKNSLFIILLSQFSSLATTLFSGAMLEVSIWALALMCLGGVIGAIVGGKIDKIMDDDITEKFFMVVLLMLILLNIYNVVQAV